MVLRNIGEETDLPARDAQYHERSHHSFKTIPTFVDISVSHVLDDAALNSCIDVMYADKSRLYNVTELHDIYTQTVECSRENRCLLSSTTPLLMM